MSESASNGAGGGAEGGGGGLQVPPSLLHGNKLTDFLMKGVPPEESADKPAAQFTKRPKSITQAEADQAAAEEGPINEQQAAVQAETEVAGESGLLDALPEGRGGKDAPFTVADLPENSYIEIKVDG